ncbi:hypothetical protein BS50DRAFT_586524 [Corynespora cassiicola Philippines]|uniref:Fungal calcium binding protein domain-containing protein n=1 Tax=Corynespora cassiicola Philippines TaxID=1448308 RepID=A0A2T2NUY6_CORCC|nr:hypothetical protein BS50DRAFT_586524 [Corynespora cassiicola Philippines]
MHFSTSIITLIASTVVASPAPKATAQRDLQAEAIAFAAQADCDLFQCANVVASAACIIASINAGPAGIPSLLACVASGSSGVSISIRVFGNLLNKDLDLPMRWLHQWSQLIFGGEWRVRMKRPLGCDQVGTYMAPRTGAKGECI